MVGAKRRQLHSEVGSKGRITMRTSKLEQLARLKRLGVNIDNISRMERLTTLKARVERAEETRAREMQMQREETVRENTRLQRENQRLREEAVKEAQKARKEMERIKTEESGKVKERSRLSKPLSRLERGFEKKIDIIKKTDLKAVQEKYDIVQEEKKKLLEEQKELIEKGKKKQNVSTELELNRIGLNQIAQEEEVYKSRINETNAKINELRDASKSVSKLMSKKEMSEADFKKIEEMREKMESFMPSEKREQIERKQKKREEEGFAKGFGKMRGIDGITVGQEIKASSNAVKNIQNRMGVVEAELAKAEALGDAAGARKFRSRLNALGQEVIEERKKMSKIDSKSLGKAMAEVRKEDRALYEALSDQKRGMRERQTKLQEEISKANTDLKSLRKLDRTRPVQMEINRTLDRLNLLQKMRKTEMLK